MLNENKSVTMVQPVANHNEKDIYMLHPRKDHNGKAVVLKSPSKPTALDAWADSKQTVCITPDAEVPMQLGPTPFKSVMALARDLKEWEQRAATMEFDEPPFAVPTGLQPAAGVVIREQDGRIWCVAPSNQIGGYQHTFPKGRLEGKSLKATTMIEALEESGLLVHLTGFLVGAKRSTTYTRYYMAERVSGNPADMGWESQAVVLAPLQSLSTLLNNANDLPILRALQEWLTNPQHKIIPARPWHWKTTAMPVQQTQLPLDLRLTKEEASAIRLGFTPSQQEDRWFSCFNNNTLFHYRSWTGYCIYQIHFVPEGDGLRATSAIVNRDPEQYGNTDDREDIRWIETMVKDLAEYNRKRLKQVS